MRRILFSTAWYRVAGLKPKLRREAAIHRHVYRGQPWFVVDDRLSGQMHRFSAATFSLAGLFDGTRTVDEVWRHGLEKLGDQAPTQDEVISFLGRLHASGLLTAEVSPETEDIFRQQKAEGRRGLMRALGAPFSMKLPLFDPDHALTALEPVARLIFSVWGFAVWLAVVGLGLWLALLNGDRLMGDVADRVLAPWSLAVMVLAYPVMKLLHELGHGLAVKRWGGRVHEVGLMFVLFVPLPYVDASAATGFPSKRARAVVGAAGVLVELFLASLALMVWLQVEPGPLRSFCHAVMVLGTISTLLFNGNPLMRFDGYYILSDLIEVPNLAQRSQAWLGWLARRSMGIEAQSPVTAKGEAGWFFFYGLASLAYRVFLAVVITLFVASAYPVIGGVLAAYAVLLMIVLPLFMTARVLVTDPGFKKKRRRVVLTLASVAALGVWAVAGVELPRRALVQGVSVAREDGPVRAGAEGFVTEILATPGARVSRGDPLIRLDDPTVQTERRAVEADVAARKAQLRVVEFSDPVEATLVRADLRASQAALAEFDARAATQVLRAGQDGVFLMEKPQDILGRFVQRGTQLAVVAAEGPPLIAAAVPQEAIAAIRSGLTGVTLWPIRPDPVPLAARLDRIVPGASNDLPDPALGTNGGGEVPLDPRATDHLRSLQPIFRVDVEPLIWEAPPRLGERFLLRFELEPETPLDWALRTLRRTGLEQFGW